MQKMQFALSMMLSVMALMFGLCFANQPILAQSSHDANAAAQQQPMQPDQSAEKAASEQTFNGKIVKSGDKLVLTADDNKTTYQLDDQQKAQYYLNKSVKVKGVLDASTGTIRISAIGPA